MKKNSTFRIAEVLIEIKDDDTPMFWIQNYGFHPGQGGMEFCYGNGETESFDDAIQILKLKLERDLDYLTELARKRKKELEEKTKDK